MAKTVIPDTNGKKIVQYLKNKKVENQKKVDKKASEIWDNPSPAVALKKENWTPEKVKAFNEYKPAKSKTLNQIIAESTVDILKKVKKSMEKLKGVCTDIYGTSDHTYDTAVHICVGIVSEYIKKEQKKSK